MDVRLIRYYITVVDEGNFSKAARHLHISQPSLSKAIQDLESRLGVQLLNRTTRSVEVTEEGRYFYEEGRRLLSHFSYVEQEMHRLKERGLPRLRIGMMESVKNWLIDTIAQYREVNEQLQIELREILSANDVKEMLITFEADVVITNHLLMEENIRTIALYEEPLALIVAEDHPLAQKEKWSREDFIQSEWVMFPDGFQTKKNTQAYFHQLDIHPHVSYEVERFETAITLVEKGLGVTFLPESYVMHLENHSRFIVKKMHEATLMRSVYLAYATNRHYSPSMQHFIRLIVQRFHR